MKLVGRYECTENGSSKFWTLMKSTEEADSYACEWGRIGSPPAGQKFMDGKTAIKKVNEKLAKGYRKVEMTKAAKEALKKLEIENDFLKELEKI